MTDTAERAVNSTWLTLASRGITIVLIPLALATGGFGFRLAIQHDRQLVRIETRLEIVEERKEIFETRTERFMQDAGRRISGAEVQAQVLVTEIRGLREQLTRIEKSLERAN